MHILLWVSSDPPPPPPSCGSKSFLRQISAKSSLALNLSFVFPLVSITVYNILRNTFLSICLTSRYVEEDLFSNMATPKRYFFWSNYEKHHSLTKCHMAIQLHLVNASPFPIIPPHSISLGARMPHHVSF